MASAGWTYSTGTPAAGLPVEGFSEDQPTGCNSGTDRASRTNRDSSAS